MSKRKPMWVVWADDKQNLDAFDYYIHWKSPIAKRKDASIIGYVCFWKKQDAIDYCIAMGFLNSYKTDHEPMRPWQRGEILYLLHDQRHSLLFVAEKTNRSIDWVQIVGGIQGRARQELINMYLEVKDDEREEFNVQSTVSRRSGKRTTQKVNTGIQSTPKRKRHTSVYSGETGTTVSRSRTKRHQSVLGRSKGTDSSTRTRKQGIADSMRNSKDYKGE